MAMKRGLYDGNSYQIYDDEGILYTVKGTYNLFDNGYHKWSTMTEPSRRPADDNDYNWTEMLESLRKDVECLFGVHNLKKLKENLLLHYCQKNHPHRRRET